MSKEIFEALAAPFPEAAIQRSKGSETKKGYDTTGYGYQYIVNRFNEVLQENWGFAWEILKETPGKYRSGQPYIDICTKVDIYIRIADKIYTRSCVGGHTSSSYTDALKGSITNSFKKTAAFWGPGRSAYEASIDDDLQPMPGADHEKNGGVPKNPPNQPTEKSVGYKIIDIIMEISGNNKDIAADFLQQVSMYTFKGEDGTEKTVNGFTSFKTMLEKASDKRLKTIYGKTKELKKQFDASLSKGSRTETILPF